MWNLPSIAYYQIVGTYLLSGIVKFFDFYQKDAAEKFVTLPKWFWPICGGWEVAISCLYLAGLKQPSIVMSYTVLGGIFYSVLFIKDKSGTTMAKKTFGAGLIPVRLIAIFIVSHLI
jgi:hypothetical protein